MMFDHVPDLPSARVEWKLAHGPMTRPSRCLPVMHGDPHSREDITRYRHREHEVLRETARVPPAPSGVLQPQWRMVLVGAGLADSPGRRDPRSTIREPAPSKEMGTSPRFSVSAEAIGLSDRWDTTITGFGGCSLSRAEPDGRRSQGRRTPIERWQRPAHPHSSRPLLLSSASDLCSPAMAQHRGRA